MAATNHGRKITTYGNTASTETAALMPSSDFLTGEVYNRISPVSINNDHTRKAYLNATRRFSAWCDGRGLRQFADVQPVHVAAFLKELQGEFFLADS